MKQENPIGKRRQKQKVETYKLILESARELFETQGFKKTTIRSVAIHAEVGLGTIYKHFDNKTSLLAAACHDDLVRLLDEAMQSVPLNAQIKDQLIFVAGFNYRYYTSRPRLAREYICQVPFVEGEWADKIEQFEQRYNEKITNLIKKAQIRGEIGEEKNCRLVALCFLANYFLVLMSLFIREKSNDSDKMLDFLKELIDQTI